MSDKLPAILTRKLGNRFSDVRATMPKHDVARFGPLNPANLKGIAVHHSAAPRDQTPAVIAAYHVSHNGWAGIGYHFVIRHGVVYYVGDIATARAHVAGRNHELIGICVTGDYTQEGVHQDDAAALRDLIGGLDEWLGRQLVIDGHGAWALAGHGTACPGALQQVAKTVRVAPAPAPGTPVPGAVQYAKVVWALEQSMRILEGEGLALEAGYLKSTALAEAIKRRDGKA